MKSKKLTKKYEDVADMVSDDCLGIYPMSSPTYNERTDYMNGWNRFVCENPLKDDCSDEFKKGYHDAQETQQKYRNKLIDWSKTHQYLIKYENVICELLDDFELFMFQRENGYEIAINANDLFYFACSDCVTIELDELVAINDIYMKYPMYALIAIASVKRGIDIINDKAKKTTAYKNAYKMASAYMKQGLLKPEVQNR